MTNAQIGDLGTAAILLVVGGLFGLFRRSAFDWRWLAAGAVLVSLNSILLTQIYGLVPNLLHGQWNWTGKALALAATLAIAASPWFGWKQSGLTLSQAPGSLRAAVPVALAYCAFFTLIAFAFPADRPNGETIAFQLTMPGFEEEPFYRGLLLLAFDRAFVGRVRFAGVDWGFGAVLSCMAFGLAHAFGYSHGSFSLDPITMALTALPAFMGVWLRYRTGSLALPVLLHNFGNAIGLIV